MAMPTLSNHMENIPSSEDLGTEGRNALMINDKMVKLKKDLTQSKNKFFLG